MNSGRADRLNAALEGRYRIEREVGAGGMATARGPERFLYTFLDRSEMDLWHVEDFR